MLLLLLFLIARASAYTIQCDLLTDICGSVSTIPGSYDAVGCAQVALEFDNSRSYNMFFKSNPNNPCDPSLATPVCQEDFNYKAPSAHPPLDQRCYSTQNNYLAFSCGQWSCSSCFQTSGTAGSAGTSTLGECAYFASSQSASLFAFYPYDVTNPTGEGECDFGYSCATAASTVCAPNTGVSSTK